MHNAALLILLSTSDRYSGCYAASSLKMTGTFPIHPITAVLGKEAGLFAHHLDRLLPELNGTLYEFDDGEKFAKRPPSERNGIYWMEILFRSHWTAAAALVRTQRCLTGFRESYTNRNLLAAAACARGLIEAAADAEYTLAVVPLTLARDCERITAAIEGRLLPRLVNPELEERLIHFTHARKPQKRDKAPPSHVALSVAAYRSRLDQVEPRVADFYRLLCDLTHPGASSVLSYAEAVTSDATRVRFAIDAEATGLEELRSAFESIISNVLMLGVNPALVTLNLLNSFPLARLHTRAMDQLDLSEIVLWQKVCAFLPEAA